MEQADTLYSISPHLILWVGLGQTGLVCASRIPGLASLHSFKLLCTCLPACVCKGGLREGLAKSVIDPHWPLKAWDQMRRTLGWGGGGEALESLSSFPDTHAPERFVGLFFCLLAVCVRAYTHRDRRFVSPGRPSAQVTDGFSSPPPAPTPTQLLRPQMDFSKSPKSTGRKLRRSRPPRKAGCLDGSLGAPELN